MHTTFSAPQIAVDAGEILGLYLKDFVVMLAIRRKAKCKGSS
jgi:hypothetical protein